MSTITVSLYLEGSVLKESSSNTTNPVPQPENTTVIISGDTLQWVLGTNSRISSIDSIVAGNGLTFTPIPTAANNWACVVTGTASETPYNYTVHVTASAGGGSKRYDPKIKVSGGHY